MSRRQLSNSLRRWDQAPCLACWAVAGRAVAGDQDHHVDPMQRVWCRSIWYRICCDPRGSKIAVTEQLTRLPNSLQDRRTFRWMQ